VVEGFYADPISAKDRVIENKQEQLRKAETLSRPASAGTAGRGAEGRAPSGPGPSGV
jgi:hypothetical protein